MAIQDNEFFVKRKGQLITALFVYILTVVKVTLQ